VQRSRNLNLGLAGGAVAALAGARVLKTEQARFARMAGSTIAAPDAAGWVTDFLNAAYYRRPEELRRLEDLRLAFALVTTAWHRNGYRRLRAFDVIPFHRAFGRDRFVSSAPTPRGTLDGPQLLDGAARRFGPWFPEAWADPGRRGWGIVFRTEDERRGYEPEARLRAAGPGPLTPPIAPGPGQTWHTYPAVPMPGIDRTLEAILAVERWTDYGTEVGRFTALRTGGLAGQAFEIEVAAGTDRGVPMFTRGYVTVTRLLTRADPEPLARWIADVEEGLARFGEEAPMAVPDGAAPIAALDLTTHENHFMGRSRNRLVLFEEHGEAKLRAVGTWDRMPWHLQQAYEHAGREAQHAFWGQGADPRASMLHQIALAAR
jgi:hypothetical protein